MSVKDALKVITVTTVLAGGILWRHIDMNDSMPVDVHIEQQGGHQIKMYQIKTSLKEYLRLRHKGDHITGVVDDAIYLKGSAALQEAEHSVTSGGGEFYNDSQRKEIYGDFTEAVHRDGTFQLSEDHDSEGNIVGFTITFQTPVDQAMAEKQQVGLPGQDTKGGIDFNAANLNLQIKRDGKGVPLPISQQDLENIHIDGLIPVVTKIEPAMASPLLSQLQLSGTQ